VDNFIVDHSLNKPAANNMNNNIDPFKYQLGIALSYLLFTLAIFSATRAFILFTVADWQSNPMNELMTVFITGLRFDLKVAAVCIILFILLPILPMSLFNRWHYLRIFSRLALLAVLLICCFFSFLDIGFYFFFGTAISNLMFGIVDDGTSAVLISIFTDWRLNLLILAAIICCITYTIYFLRVSKGIKVAKHSSVNKAIIWLLTIILIVICALFGRGSLDKFPLSRRTTVINDNPIVNSLALNGPYHFYYALKDADEDSFSSLTAASILKSAKLTSLQQLEAAAGYSSTNPLIQTTTNKGAEFKKPNVIFVLMEGWSSQIAQAHNPDNLVLGNFARHAEQDYFFKRIFSNEYGTNPTIERLLLNTPIGPISQSKANAHSFTTSNVLPFKRQNYSTLFLSGGNSSWRKHGEFWPKQGFDQYIGRATIEKHFQHISDNPWGVYDSFLFEYLQKQLTEQAPDKPLFSFVLTTNNHGPIRLPKDYVAPNLSPQAYGFEADDAKTKESLTGYHFQTNAFGNFLTWLKQSEFADNTIVVATGDHILKGFDNYAADTDAYNRYAVATYLYVPKALDQLSKADELIPGSHQDLFPTLFELSLDKETYYSFGVPFTKKTLDSAYGSITQGAYIVNTGISTNTITQSLWKAGSTTQLANDKAPLSTLQQRLIKQQSFKEILEKYLLIEQAKP
jgi:phosphoglycerol transferase MdoB-like AlkP superfamily enzyme